MFCYACQPSAAMALLLSCCWCALLCCLWTVTCPATVYGRLKALSWLCRLTANVLEGSTVLYLAEVRPSQREGAYEVSFKPEISGVYGLAVCLEGGRALKGSPFRVRAKTDETVAANCKIYGGGLTRAMAGQETLFTIQGHLPIGHVHGDTEARSCVICLSPLSYPSECTHQRPVCGSQTSTCQRAGLPI